MDTVKTVDGQSQRRWSSLAFEEVKRSWAIFDHGVFGNLCVINGSGGEPLHQLNIANEWYRGNGMLTIDRAANWETNSSAASKPPRIHGRKDRVQEKTELKTDHVGN
ncbi:unnamed protein product [Porites evermanni]|uniref:Uncharacterized protein n=1 Tax=Porites evermanni TaxID=104178 RepID=A0ABN8R8E5_9CNID|nr:unnamed protein product [Porites evermanni]